MHSHCTCYDFCDKCSVRYVLKKKCPPDMETCEVTSNDFVQEAKDDKSRSVMPVRYFDDNGIEEHPILIMKLSKNQMIDFKCIAKKDTAKTHAKWSPVATCLMRKEPIVELDQEKINRLTVEEKIGFVASCPRKVYQYDAMRQAVDIEDFNKCNLCDECNKFATEKGQPGSVRMDEREDKFIFEVESTGAIKPQNIVLKAIQVLKRKLRDLSQPI